ncbi:MAG: Spy/CpxP family protein refolding chaperone, partial [Ramlibacter sp.]
SSRKKGQFPMKYAHKHIIVAAMLAALGLAASAQTPPPGAPGAGQNIGREHHGRMDPARMQERMAKRMGMLKQKLQITPAQEGAWTTYTTALKPTQFNRPQRGEFDKLTTPERIDRMRSMHATRAAEMDKRADATKTFYAALSAEQKKVFDTESIRRGHHGDRHHGRHHKG